MGSPEGLPAPLPGWGAKTSPDREGQDLRMGAFTGRAGKTQGVGAEVAFAKSTPFASGPNQVTTARVTATTPTTTARAKP
jgi:hypothetical protein